MDKFHAQQHFEPHRRYLWAVLYRLTGCAADADDLVQETFLRALEQAPADLQSSLRPWLVRVAVNLGKDHLRRRRRSPYAGPWLPSPIDTAGPGEEAPPSYELATSEGGGTEGRYDLLESVSYAFLLAMEMLTPQQRAVLLLRDVFDYSTAETADVLAIGESNVKTTLYRARKAMRDYDTSRAGTVDGLAAATRVALDKFLSALVSRDAAAIEALLAEEAVATSDSGGEFLAARKTVVGPARIAKYFIGISPDDTSSFDVSIRYLNGLPAFVVNLDTTRIGRAGRLAPRFVARFDLGPDGRIVAIHNILASRKLTAVHA